MRSKRSSTVRPWSWWIRLPPSGGPASLLHQGSPMRHIDEVIGGIGQEGRPAGAAVHRDCGSLREMRLGTVSASVASSSPSRYSRTARLNGPGPASPGFIPRHGELELPSAATMLASTAKPSPLTRPAAMQACTTSSNSQRKVSLSRKRPCRSWRRWNGPAPRRPAPAAEPAVGQVELHFVA